jgi:molecular chaperone GrpE
MFKKKNTKIKGEMSSKDKEKRDLDENSVVKEEKISQESQQVSSENPKQNSKDEISWQEKFLRVNADFQNFKRRVDKEKSEWVNFAQIDTIKSFLPLIDELDIAMKSSKKCELKSEIRSWLNGFEIIQKNLIKKLSELGVEQIDCRGEFDPNLHEALIRIDSEDQKSGQIVEVISPGYLFKGKVIRHAKVSVAK